MHHYHHLEYATKYCNHLAANQVVNTNDLTFHNYGQLFWKVAIDKEALTALTDEKLTSQTFYTWHCPDIDIKFQQVSHKNRINSTTFHKHKFFMAAILSEYIALWDK